MTMIWHGLDWGCGPDLHPDWLGSDCDDHGQSHVGDIADGLPWDTDTFSLIVTHHALQMIAYPSLVPALAELRRVLRPGGVLRVSVPSLTAAIHAWELGEREHFQVASELESSLDGKFVAYLTQCSATRSLFTGPWLCELLDRAGFAKTMVAAFGVTNSPWPEVTECDTRPAESLFVEAWK